MYSHCFKRLIDFGISLITFIVLFPIFLVIVLLLCIEQGKDGIFFFQERPGKDGKLFKIIKFQTMNNNCDESGNLLPDLKRITRIGNFLRKSSLDEIPQLLNVIKGDMSLIGPRPLLVQYLPLYSAEQARRHNVRPGITGWAQVHGRNSLSWTEKFKLDTWYVDHLSFKVDVEIILQTLIKVFQHEDINNENSEGNITTPNFDGTN